MARSLDDDEEPGGESVCYLQYFCEECGVLLDGREHVNSCTGASHPAETDIQAT